jgi:hypothetical protein
MPKFKPGDLVQRIGESLLVPDMREGVVIRVVRIPQTLGDTFTQYEVAFTFGRTTLFEAQLAPAEDRGRIRSLGQSPRDLS